MPSTIKVCFLLLLIIIATKPTSVHAGLFSGLFGTGAQAADISVKDETAVIHNSQTIPLPESSIDPDLRSIKETKTITIVSNEALVPDNSPLGTDTDLEKYASSEKIDAYIVKKGDTLDSIAKKLNISKDTIIASNADLKKSDLLKIGQKLVILGGINTSNTKQLADKTVKSDDTTLKKEVTKATDEKEKAKTPAKEETTKKDKGPMITINTDLPSPSAVVPQVETPVVNTPVVQPQVETQNSQPEGTIKGNYIWPFAAGTGRISQGLHADQACDFAAPKNTPILAIQDGTVFIVHSFGYNGGYGKYVVINFDDGRQAIFGHMNKTNVEEGQKVSQGDIIGFVGTTGSSTGYHTHIGWRGPLGSPYECKVNSNTVDHD